MNPLALSWPGPFEALLLVLLLLVVIALPIIVLTVAFRLSRGKRQPAFPVLPSAEPDGPGRYRVIGVDKTTRADRELTVDAASRANAQVKAELEGIVVTNVTRSS
jgi:hypothetical protein